MFLFRSLSIFRRTMFGRNIRERGNGRESHPKHLKGREIGLWHAQRNKKLAEQNELQRRPTIFLNETDRTNLVYVLDRMDEKFGSCSTGGHYEKGNSKVSREVVSWRPVTAAAADFSHKPQSVEFDKQFSNKLFSKETESLKTSSNNNNNIRDEDVFDDDDEQLGDFCTGSDNDLGDLDEYDSNLCVKDELVVVNDYNIQLNSFSDTTKSETASCASEENLNDTLLKQLYSKRNSAQYKTLLAFRETLPAYMVRDELVDAVRNNRVVIIQGQTGCGKSTQVPQLILDDQIHASRGANTFIVCTEPRRIAAVSLATRVADERNEFLGTSVGYQIRLTNESPRSYGSVVYCTTGVVLRWLKSDPQLTRISHLVLDEVHERDILSDFLMVIVRDLLLLRPDLRVILMSATMDVESFMNYFKNFNPVLKSVRGRLYNVQKYFLEDVFAETGYCPPTVSTFKRVPREVRIEKQEHLNLINKYCLSNGLSSEVHRALVNWDTDKIDLELILSLTTHICNKEIDSNGAILIFLPGWEEITNLHKLMSRHSLLGNSAKFDLIPLHSMLPFLDQQKVFTRSLVGRRKIILATNIAETSVTIDDVVYVIDCGKIKQTNFDKTLNVSTLDLEWISVSNMDQRSGRAGRCRDGVCFHLFPSFFVSNKFEIKTTPEMMRVRMENLCLQVKYLGLSDVCVNFLQKSMDPPSKETIMLALDELYDIGAVDANEKLTKLGFQLATIPADPHLSKMLLYSVIFSCVGPITTVVACADFKDPFVTPLGKELEVDEVKYNLCPAGTYSDYALWINVFRLWRKENRSGDGRSFARDHFLNHSTLIMIEKLKGQFVDALKSLGFVIDEANCNKNSNDFNIVSAVIVAGLYPKIASVKRVFANRPPLFSTKTVRRLQVHKKSVNSNAVKFPTPYLVYHVCVKSYGVYLHDCGLASPLALVLLAKNLTFVPDTKSMGLIKVDDTFRFNAHPQLFRLLLRLNERLKNFVDRICSSPGLPLTDIETDFLDFVSYLIKSESY